MAILVILPSPSSEEQRSRLQVARDMLETVAGKIQSQLGISTEFFNSIGEMQHRLNPAFQHPAFTTQDVTAGNLPSRLKEETDWLASSKVPLSAREWKS